MSKKYLDTVGLNKLVANILSKFAAKNHSHSNATTNSAGFMSSSDKVKLDGVSTGANRTIVDSTLSSTSVNAIQNKAVKAALDGKAASSHTHPTAQITGLDAALAGKAPSSHSHSADNITSGVLPIGRGGTGASSSKGAQYNIMNDILEGTVNASDSDVFILKHHTPTATDGALLTRSAAQVWAWIKSKCDGLYQPRGSYASSSHTHTIANVSNLQSTLDSKAPVSHTHSNATATASGFMSNTDKSKLDGVSTGANKTIVDASFSATSTNPVQNKVVKAALDAKASSSHTHTIANITNLQSTLDSKQPKQNPVTTSGTGAAYTAAVPGVTSLVAGATFTMIPHVVSATVSPTLNVNNLGAKPIRQRLSNSTQSTVTGAEANWLAAGKPVDIMYDGQYWVVDFVRPNMASAYGALPVANGGVPSCTTSDNGKFLCVSNGVAAWSYFYIYTEVVRTSATAMSSISGRSIYPTKTTRYRASLVVDPSAGSGTMEIRITNETSGSTVKSVVLDKYNKQYFELQQGSYEISGYFYCQISGYRGTLILEEGAKIEPSVIG